MRRRALALVLFTAACSGTTPTGLMPTPAGTGPQVVFDLEAKPLPEIPLPSDLATRMDPTSPTGRRVNISLEAPTQFERDLRAHANEMEGFGTYAPISVRFGATLDIANIVRRQRDNKDFSDDVVLLVNLQRGSPKFGRLTPLDFGQGNFPLTVADPNRYWVNDPRASVENLLYDTTDEDLNHNGRLDLGEDSDGDGWLDVPNLFPEGGDKVDDLLTFYEKVTNTLIVRPVLPLEQESLYAVVLTKNLRGADGQPVRSPFPFVNHAHQTDQLRDLPLALGMNGFSMNDVAFTWSFTTQGPTRDLEALRRGLYGNGPFARLAKEFPAAVTLLSAYSEGPKPHLLRSDTIKQFAGAVIPLLFSDNPAGVRRVVESFANVDYMIHGEVEGPNLLADKNGIATPGMPADEDEVWKMNRRTGEAYYKPQRVGFWCSVPKKTQGNGPPFPVAFYMHGHTSSRFDILGFAGVMARYGIALCGVSAYGHGLVIPPDFQPLAAALTSSLHLEPFISHMSPDRARDLDNDGIPDSGVDFWTGDLFHLRDMVRQSVLDHMLVIRALRSFDGVRRGTQDLDGDGKPDLAGDFDGDGIVDIGGPHADYFVWGHSLGGILSAVTAGIEPALTAAAPVCFAAGLSDVGLRTARFGVPNTAVLPVLGPIVVGEPGPGPNEVTVSMIVRSLLNAPKLALLTTDSVSAGDRVRVENLVNGEASETIAGEGGRFRLHIPADALEATPKRALLKLPVTPDGQGPPPVTDTPRIGDRLRITVVDHTGTPKKVFERFEKDVVFEGATYPAGAPLIAVAKGLGLQRNTPRFRQLLGGLTQVIVEPGDPVNYAPHYFLDPLPVSDYDDVEPGVNVLLMPTVGDPGVSVGTGISGARAAGLIDLYSVNPRYGKTTNEVLIDNYIVEGLSRLRRFGGQEVLMDPDDLSQGRWAPEAPRLDPPLRLTLDTGKGLQALRLPLLDPRGQHCFGIAEPDSQFDNNTFLIHLITRYFQTRGREIRDEDVCLADESCSWIPPNAP